MIKERRGVSCWEHAWECKNMHGERSRSAFEQGGEQQGWWEGFILKLGQPQRKGDIWISAAGTLNTLKTFSTAVKSLKTFDMLKLCANAGGSISLSFFYHVFFPRSHFRRRQVQGGRDAPLFGYMEIPPPPNPSQCVRRDTVVQILYLSYYWGGWGGGEIRAVFPSALLN